MNDEKIIWRMTTEDDTFYEAKEIDENHVKIAVNNTIGWDSIIVPKELIHKISDKLEVEG